MLQAEQLEQLNMLAQLAKETHDKHFFKGMSAEQEFAASQAVVMDLQKGISEGMLWKPINDYLRAKRESKLSKALATTTFGAYQGIDALRIEDLSKILVRQVESRNTVPFQKKIKRVKAINITSRYNRLTELGQYDSGFPWLKEGGVPRGDDSKYDTQYKTIRFAGTLRAVTDPSVRVVLGGTSGQTNLKAMENENGMTWLLQQLEQSLFFNKASCSVVDGMTIGPDGFIEQIIQAGITPNIIDKHGKGLVPSDFNQGCTNIETIGKFDFPEDPDGRLMNLCMMCDPFQSNHISEHIAPLSRVSLGGRGRTITPGQSVRHVRTNYGDVPIVRNRWISKYRRLNEGDRYMPTAPVGPNPPNAPTFTVAPNAPVVAGSEWEATDESTTIWYGLTAMGPNGETAGVTAAGAITVLENGSATLTITPPATNVPMAYKVWRGTSATTMEMVDVIPPGTTSPFTWEDKNYWMPGTAPAVLFVTEDQVIDIHELTPPFTMDLGIIDTSYRWMILCYLILRLKNPLQVILYKNCGLRT